MHASLSGTFGESIRCGAPDSLRGAGDDHVFLHDSARALLRFAQIGRRCPLEGEPITNFADDPFLQRLDKVHACVSPGHFRGLEIVTRELPRPGDGPSIPHDFGDDAPLLSRARRERRGAQEERFGAPRAGAITPRGEDTVAGHDARSEMTYVLKGRTLPRHDDVSEQGVLGMDMRASLDGRDDGDAYVGDVLENLDPSSCIWLQMPGSETSLKDVQSTPIMKSPPAPVRIKILLARSWEIR
jgi:hypothetical protein